MAKVLVAWELGGGLGHLMPLAPLIRGLSARGHRVYVALKELGSAGRVLAGADVSFLQAPFHTGGPNKRGKPDRTFAGVLYMVGYHDAEELRVQTEAWRHLLDYVQPDLLLCDHSPTTLLAARGRAMRRVVFGLPFACPPDVSPLPDLRPWLGGEPGQYQTAEPGVLDCVNQVLASMGQPPLDRLTQLYHPVDETMITTFAELDHYARPNGTKYWGVWPSRGGLTPDWPDAKGKRVFAYLKPFPALPSVLKALNEIRAPTLVVLGKPDPRLQERLKSPTLRFAPGRLDPELIHQQCDMAILNGGHGLTASMLLAGKPILQLPLYVEQTLNSKGAMRTGSALLARINQPEEIAVKLMLMLGTERFSEAARRFAARYANFDGQLQLETAIDRLDELARSPAS